VIAVISDFHRMPKKRTPKDQARYYTTTQRSRLHNPVQPKESIKDVTTQLYELRIEQARERQQNATLKMTTGDRISNLSPLGFTPANYTMTQECPNEAAPPRRIPGPAPPRSWIERPRNKLHRTSIPEIVRSRTDPTPPFPGLELPSRRSLIHHSLLALGTHFYDHQEVNKYNLPSLGVQLKQWLLTYIAAKNIAGAITKEGLDVLFPRTSAPSDPEEMIEIIRLSKKDEIYLKYLDLSDSLGTLTLSQLRTFLSPHLPLSTSQEWYISTPRFPSLTHLSLDVSPVHTLKIDHLKLAHILSQHCSRLTHLSIAGVFTSATSASALIHLSKTLVCLEYIDLSRTPVLHERYGNPYLSAWDDNSENSQRGRLLDRLNWEGAWRKVRVLVVRKCGFTRDMEKGVREGILGIRGGKGWIQIITQ
jgi:hypothetical protein